MNETLPIHSVLNEIKEVLGQVNTLILQAPPGAGKTTVVPLALMEESWLNGQKIVMLEPRRLAARAAAQRMAEALGEKVGERVGLRIRGESRVSKKTRIEVVTEGVLTRMLQADPSLEGVGLVIFDEFHERSLQADMGLAMVLEGRRLFREELRVLPMSATLQA
ncbi:DEAD/DEAH box helicase [Hydrogenimonas sp.]